MPKLTIYFICSLVYKIGVNDGFLPNVLKTLFRLSIIFLDLKKMLSKRHYKICICSVILGELKSFRNYLTPLSITFLNLKILGFLFPLKNLLK